MKLEGHLEQIVKKGTEAWRRVKKSRDLADWWIVGEALQVIQEEAMNAAGIPLGTNQPPSGATFNAAMGELLQRYKLDDIDKGARSRLLTMMKQRSAIESWHRALPLNKRLSLNHPSSVMRHWLKHTEPPKPPTEKKPTTLEKTETELAKAYEEVDQLRAHVSELEAARDSRMTPSADSPAWAWKIAAEEDDDEEGFRGLLIAFSEERCGSGGLFIWDRGEGRFEWEVLIENVGERLYSLGSESSSIVEAMLDAEEAFGRLETERAAERAEHESDKPSTELADAAESLQRGSVDAAEPLPAGPITDADDPIDDEEPDIDIAEAVAESFHDMIAPYGPDRGPNGPFKTTDPHHMREDQRYRVEQILKKHQVSGKDIEIVLNKMRHAKKGAKLRDMVPARIIMGVPELHDVTIVA